ncbi:MAG: DUF4124 domain-containing protein [Rhodanobacteraceae bacterium]
MNTIGFAHRFFFGIVLTATGLAAFAKPAHAESVFRCRGADGAVAFQDRACGNANAQSIVEIAPAPPLQPSPDYGVASAREPRVAHTRSGVRASREPVSFACHAANGETFYRHGSCPKQIALADAGGHGKPGKGAKTVGVTAEAMPRADVCRELSRGGSIGRAGHARDETISSYERNLGRDPCRHL